MRTKRGPECGGGPIEHENLDDKVYARVRGMIVSGRYEPGSRIVQEDLAGELGVSRTPLVNALKRLAQDGLLEWTPRRGIHVRALEPGELVHLFVLRERLEPLAAELAARNITRAEALEMEEEWASMAGLPDTPESHRLFVDRDRRFHWRLAELAGQECLHRPGLLPRRVGKDHLIGGHAQKACRQQHGQGGDGHAAGRLRAKRGAKQPLAGRGCPVLLEHSLSSGPEKRGRVHRA
ncbi:MAG: GntR family transcriptional regulator [Thermodesulfobacteriota bacterium]